MTDVTVDSLAGLSGSLLGLSTLAVALRFHARYKQKAALLADDWLMVPAWLSFVGLAALAFYGIENKFMGYYMPKDKKLVDDTHPIMQKTYYAIDVISVLAFGFAKLSAVFFYRRIFCSSPFTRDAFNILTLLAAFIVAAWTVAFTLMGILMCGADLEYLWPAGHSANCHFIYPYMQGTAISDFILDVMILILPIPKIWGLHTTTKRKIGILGVFLLGMAGLGASTARMVLFNILVSRGRATNDQDSYKSNVSGAFFQILEAGLVIIAVNLPSLWYYVAGVTPDRVLRSVRSMLSLRSPRGSQNSLNKASHGPSQSHPPPGAMAAVERKPSSDSHSSHTYAPSDAADPNAAPYLAYPKDRGVATYALADANERQPLEKEGEEPASPGIRVKHSLQRVEDQI